MSAERKAAKQANRENGERTRDLHYRTWFDVVWHHHRPRSYEDTGNAPLELVKLYQLLKSTGAQIRGPSE